VPAVTPTILRKPPHFAGEVNVETPVAIQFDHEDFTLLLVDYAAYLFAGLAYLDAIAQLQRNEQFVFHRVSSFAKRAIPPTPSEYAVRALITTPCFIRADYLEHSIT